MAAMVQHTIIPSPDVVGNAFVHQYYLILHKSPNIVHRFYQPISKLGRPEKDGAMSTTTGSLDAIDEKILSLDYGNYTAEITTVDSQESHNGGVLVLVTGFLIDAEGSRQKFCQSFFLAPQDNGYFVLNDVFRCVDVNEPESKKSNCGSNGDRSLLPKQDSLAQEDHISLQPEEPNGEEPYDPSEHEEDVIEDSVPAVSEADVVMIYPEVANESCSKTEEVEKKSYASILKVMKESSSCPSPTVTTSKTVSKPPEEPVHAVVPVAEPDVDIPAASFNSIENLNPQENEAFEGPSIYIRNLPLDATRTLIENEFGRFGTIRPNGVQVKLQKGYCFGFVEYEGADAVHNAIDASPIIINGCKVNVEEKRSTSRGNNRGRFLPGNSNGYGNNGIRGRGNYGNGKTFPRTGFRTDFGGRGGGRAGYSNRGSGEGYRRGNGGERMSDGGERMSNGGGRAKRGNGLGMNGAARNMTPRVSATA